MIIVILLCQLCHNVNSLKQVLIEILKLMIFHAGSVATKT